MAAEALQAGCLWVRYPRGGIVGVFVERVGGSCRGRGWRICLIVEDWAGTVVVVAAVVEARIVAVAAFAVEACQSAAVRSAVAAAAAAFVAEAYRSVVEPFVFARTDSESQPERTSAYSVAVCWLEACSSAAAAAPALAAVY